ncbi:tRNA-binding protein [bacterium]|nr:tRNA-binding protein [bacterium]
MISWSDFEKIDIRVGTILSASIFEEAIKPAYKLEIDFGATIGILNSSAQITDGYRTEQLPGKQILAVVNFPPKQIGPFMSQCLVLGIYSAHGVVLFSPDSPVANGLKVG